MKTSPDGLFSRVVPHDGETLLSLITRSAEQNVHPRLHAFLRLAGIKVLKPDHIPFTRTHEAEKLSAWLGADYTKITMTMHPAINLGYDDFVHWYGTRLPRGFIDAKAYRYSPRTLKLGGFQRAEWTLRPLSFCPYSKELLLDACPTCGRRQGWRYRSSMDICGKCRTPLTVAETSQVSANLAEDAVNAAKLASPDHFDRRRALDMLPTPFRDWEAGEVFAAVVELGALEMGDAPNKRELVRKIKTGDFSSYEISNLVRGYRFVKGWPQSLEAELRRLDIKGTLRLPVLAGPFGKYFYKSVNPTPLTILMREEVPRVLHSLGIVPPRSSGCCPTWVKKGNTLTQNEAVKLLRVDASTLRRLHGRGRCVVVVHERRVGHLYDKDGLSASLAVLRGAARDLDCAKEIGAPRHCFEQLLESGFLVGVDHDASLMADGPLFDPSSLRELKSKLCEVPLIAGRGTQTVQSLLEGRFHPADWADAIATILSGRMGFVRRSKHGPVLANGIIEEHGAKLFLASLPQRDPPKNISVSATAAGKILGISYVYLSRAVSLGLLRANQRRNPLEIDLPELAHFHQTYITGAEGNQLFALKRGQFSRQMRAGGFLPVAELYGDTFWDRVTAEKWFGKLRE